MKIVSISDPYGHVGAQYEVSDALAAALTDVTRRINRNFVEADPTGHDTSGQPGVAPIGSFSWALERLKAGARVCRRAWRGSPKTILLAGRSNLGALAPYASGYLPFLREMNARDEYQPWTPSHADLLADDWEETDEAKAVSACRHTHFTLTRDGQTVCSDCGALVSPEAEKSKPNPRRDNPPEPGREWA